MLTCLEVVFTIRGCQRKHKIHKSMEEKIIINHVKKLHELIQTEWKSSVGYINNSK